MLLVNATYPLFISGNFRLYLENRNEDFEAILNSTSQLTQDYILTKLFGEVMYTDFTYNYEVGDYPELITGYKLNGNFSPYTYGGSKYIYKGLTDMVAYFTYFNYIQNAKNFNPQIVERSSDVRLSDPVIASFDAYRNGYYLYYSAKRFIEYKKSLNSLLFPDFDFSDIELINSFGI